MSLTYYTISTLVALSISVYLVLKKSTTIATMVDLTKMALLHWPKQPPQNKVDTHHHFVPDFYAAAVESAGGDPSGWQTPSWSLTRSDAIMSRLGIKTVILSVTAPGACILKGKASYELARRLNGTLQTCGIKILEKLAFSQIYLVSWIPMLLWKSLGMLSTPFMPTAWFFSHATVLETHILAIQTCTLFGPS